MFKSLGKGFLAILCTVIVAAIIIASFSLGAFLLITGIVITVLIVMYGLFFAEWGTLDEDEKN